MHQGPKADKKLKNKGADPAALNGQSHAKVTKDTDAGVPAPAPLAKKAQTERGISTIFRIMAANQSNLSQMADSKANILISVNAIILTIVISTLFTRLETETNLKIPVAMLVTVSVAAIVFAILATRPSIHDIDGRFTKDDVVNKRTNLLFFGNFYRMDLEDYDWAMTELIEDRDYIYSSIVQDNYHLGVILARKYRYLRMAYNIFMYGLIIAMIAFAIAFTVPGTTEVYTPG